MILRYWWVVLVSLGFLPALLLTNVLLESVASVDSSCTRVEFGAPGSQYGGCSIIAGELIVAVTVSWIAPLSLLAALLYLMRHARQGEGSQGDLPGLAEGDRSTVGWLGLFVRVVAVLVGLANVLVIGDPRGVFSEDGPPLLGTFLLAVVAGLVSSEVVLRLGRSFLSSGFFARYGITVLGMCLGGAMLGGSSLALGLVTSQPGAQSSGEGVAFLMYAALAYGLIAAVVGGALGALEGMVLGLPLAAVLGKFRRTPDQARGASLPGMAVSLCLLVVAAAVSYATTPATPPEAATATLRDNPPLSCQGGKEEIGAFEGPGDQITPTFETTGEGWGYEVSSVGSGSLSVAVLDEDGNEVESSEEQGPGDDFLSGAGVGGAEFSFSGTFRLEIEADDNLEYEVLVCD